MYTLDAISKILCACLSDWKPLLDQIRLCWRCSLLKHFKRWTWRPTLPRVTALQMVEPYDLSRSLGERLERKYVQVRCLCDSSTSCNVGIDMVYRWSQMLRSVDSRKVPSLAGGVQIKVCASASKTHC